MNRCLRCGKKLPKKKGITPGRKRKFCNDTCQTRYNATKRYYRLRNNPKFKKKCKKNFDRWRKDNREHFNELMREPSKIRERKETVLWRRRGLCTKCGRKKEDERFMRCRECRRKQRKWARGKLNIPKAKWEK